MTTVVVLCAVLLGQTEPVRSRIEQEYEKAQFDRWQKYYRQVAAEYDMEAGADRRTALALHSEPVFKWFNPAGGALSHGAMFVWTKDGRPEIVGTIWSRQPEGSPRFTVHSLHSLSLEPLSATRRGSVFWSPQAPGIEPVLFPGAEDPVESPPLRLTQMRNMARELTATTMPPGQRERRLEFRPQPIYRFENPTIERDGAVFIWLDNSDPELVTLIETRPTSDGPKWHVSFARFAGTPVKAEHKETEIWRFEENAQEFRRGGQTSRYISVHGVDTNPTLPE